MDSNFTDIPVVDLARWHSSSTDRSAFAKEVRDICHHIGFFIVRNHRVAASLVDTMFKTSRRFFDLPLEQKLLIDKRESRHFRGWEPEGTEYTNNRPDIREQVDLWTEHPTRPIDSKPIYLRLYGPNQWLPDDVLPEFRTTCNAWFDCLGALADELMGVLAVGLGLPESHFKTLFGNEPMSLMKLIRYPATPSDGFGVNAHHDAGFLTVLAPGTTPGLQVQNAAKEWIPVPIVPDTFVINLGEMLQSLTGNYYVATPHRVVTDSLRYSVGYFHGPSLATPLSPISLASEFSERVCNSARHANAGFMAQRDETEAGVGDMQSTQHPDVYGQQLWNYLARSYPENMERHYPADV